MKERPILFSGSMIRQILAGNKTQTRRVIKFPSGDSGINFPMAVKIDGCYEWIFWSTALFNNRDFTQKAYKCGDGIKCPYGQPGDQLWVRETWWINPNDITTQCKDFVIYRQEYSGPKPRLGWLSPIFMPRWACRLILEITNINVERLQDIRPRDCLAEGIEDDVCLMSNEPVSKPIPYEIAIKIARNRFQELWDSLNTKRGYPWSSNPWVWKIEFKVVKP
jgi:hypothetical protein